MPSDIEQQAADFTAVLAAVSKNRRSAAARLDHAHGADVSTDAAFRFRTRRAPAAMQLNPASFQTTA